MPSLALTTASSALHGLTMGIYQYVTKQGEVIQEQEDTVQFLNEANMLIDVECATGLLIKEETARLDTLRIIRTDMENRLDLTIGSGWRNLNQSNISGEVTDLTCSQHFDTAQSPEPIPRLDDPLVSTKARYTLAHNNYRKALFVAPSQLMKKPELTFSRSLAKAKTSNYSRWWASPDNLLAGETAGVAGRPYGAPDFVAPMHRSFTREVSKEAMEIKQFRYPLIPDHVPTDPEFDPDFWNKQLQHRGDIFANKFTVFQSTEYTNETATNNYREYSPCEPASPLPSPVSRESFTSALRGYTPMTKIVTASTISYSSDISSDLSSLASTPSVSDFDLRRNRNLNRNLNSPSSAESCIYVKSGSSMSGFDPASLEVSHLLYLKG